MLGFDGLWFRLWRFFEIITLIPTVGMLAWFVDGYNKAHILTPSFILVLFIVSVLALAWALVTVIRMSSTRRNAAFIAFIDLCFVGAFIAGVYYLRGIGNASCASFASQNGDIYQNLGPFGNVGVSYNNNLALHLDKNCSMLKASWVFGIMNCIFFFFTFILAAMLHNRDRVVVKERTVRRHHSSRRGHSRSVSGGSRRGSRRSSSQRRSYYV